MQETRRTDGADLRPSDALVQLLLCKVRNKSGADVDQREVLYFVML